MIYALEELGLMQLKMYLQTCILTYNLLMRTYDLTWTCPKELGAWCDICSHGLDTWWGLVSNISSIETQLGLAPEDFQPALTANVFHSVTSTHSWELSMSLYTVATWNNQCPRISATVFKKLVPWLPFLVCVTFIWGGKKICKDG